MSDIGELEGRLEPFRRRLVAQRLRRAARSGLSRARFASLLIALAIVLWQLGRMLGAHLALPAPTWFAMALMVLGAAGLAFVVVLGRERPWRLGPLETVRCLDRAFDPADRVTSAWCFLASGADGAFAQLSIEDGVRKVAEYDPERLPPGHATADGGGLKWALWGAVLGLAALSIAWRPSALGSASGGSGNTGTRELLAAAEGAGEVGTKAREREREARPLTRPVARESAGSERSERREVAGQHGRAERGSQQAGEGSSSAARREPYASSQGGSTAAGKSPAEPNEGRRARKPRNQPKPKPKRKPPGRPTDAEKSSAVMAAALGSAGSFRAVSNPWKDQEQAFDREDEGESEEGEVDDEQSESKQRGGLQPSKKDRRSSPSRDLSLGLGKKPGNGRGGPSPQKKARGTAALVLGRRLPEFIPGTPNPGTSKVDTQPTLPSQRPPGARRDEVEHDALRAVESQLPADEIPPEFADLVRQLFERRTRSEHDEEVSRREQH